MHYKQFPSPNILTRTRSIWRDYLSLTKPRFVALMLLTMLAAMLIAGDTVPSPAILLWTLLSGALAVGGAGALNCYFDRDLDAQMLKTRQRPLPAQHLRPDRALYFGLLLSVVSIVLFWTMINLPAALLALGAIIHYVVVYTLWLKRRTPHSVVIGGAAGAVPPLVGWAAGTGTLEPMAFLLGAIIFYWMPPHFWALALKIKGDYARANIPAFPVVLGDRATRRYILFYTIPMVILTLVPVHLEQLGLFYGLIALTLGSMFIFYAVRVCRRRLIRDIDRLFGFSTIYLALLFVTMVIDHGLG